MYIKKNSLATHRICQVTTVECRHDKQLVDGVDGPYEGLIDRVEGPCEGLVDEMDGPCEGLVEGMGGPCEGPVDGMDESYGSCDGMPM